MPCCLVAGRTLLIEPHVDLTWADVQFLAFRLAEVKAELDKTSADLSSSQVSLLHPSVAACQSPTIPAYVSPIIALTDTASAMPTC